MTLKEYIAIAVVIFFLIVLSETKIKIGIDKFDQLACSAHLKKIYDNLITSISEDPEIFARNPNLPWYKCIKNIDENNLQCPSAGLNTGSVAVNYSFNNTIYESIKRKENFAQKYERKMLIMDSEPDPTGFYLFPMVNPSFRHNGGCNILLTNGSVVWCDKNDFVSDELDYSEKGNN